jgi:hypothetical protein
MARELDGRLHSIGTHIGRDESVAVVALVDRAGPGDGGNRPHPVPEIEIEIVYNTELMIDVSGRPRSNLL